MVLLRHARTGHNAQGRTQGQLDIALDEAGRSQAAVAARRLAELEPAALWSSDLARARETADALAAVTGLRPHLDPRLRELHLGAWQGLTLEQARERFPEEHAAWLAGGDVARGGGETYAEAGERAASAVREALAGVPDGGTLVAVTHGGTARALLGVLLELPAEHWWRLGGLDNACWATLVEASPGWRLEQHNASADVALDAADSGPGWAGPEDR